MTRRCREEREISIFLNALFAVKTILSCSVCRAVLNTESAISHVRLPSRKNDPDQISNLKINTNQI